MIRRPDVYAPEDEPWTPQPDPDTEGEWEVKAGDKTVACCPGGFAIPTQDASAADIIAYSQAESKRHAHFISATPDLYRAAGDLMPFLNDEVAGLGVDHDLSRKVAALSSAIAKADADTNDDDPSSS